MRKLIVAMLALLAGTTLMGQYTLNGNASQDDCHCYTLTQDAFSQSGSIWNSNKINLTQSFDFKFDVFLGCTDLEGADGIVFVLQPISTSVGSQGGGLGYSGVSPAVGVTIDTWQNGSPIETGPDGDPPFDHIAIQLNGDLNHKDSMSPLPVNNIAGPVTALDGSDNIEDCQWHILRVQWDVTTQTLNAYIDGKLRVTATIDLVNDVFRGDPLVFWGFTGSTGGAKNLQQVCTALKPIFRFLPDQKRCLGESVTFYDSTISFAPILKSYWNFGDGSPIDSVNRNPVHTYGAAGIYTVKQTVVGAEGCTEINTQQVLIGSKPVADFTSNNACMSDSTVAFQNNSTATFGTITNWYWELDNGISSGLQSPRNIYNTAGIKQVRLAVKSQEGCLSDTVTRVLAIYEKPVADFTLDGLPCTGSPLKVIGSSVVQDGTITNWYWTSDRPDTLFANSKEPIITFNQEGMHNLSLVTRTSYGCLSDPVSRPVTINQGAAAAFTYDPVCVQKPTIFHASSVGSPVVPVNEWWWDFGNGNTSLLQDPEASYGVQGDVVVKLVVTSANGCVSDTLKQVITVSAKPVAGFGYASPLCADREIQFLDSSAANSSTILKWKWLFDTGGTSGDKDPVVRLAAGPHLVALVVENREGCSSDTASSRVVVNSRPVVDFLPVNACENSVVTFVGQPIEGTISSWAWHFDNGNNSNAAVTTHYYGEAGVFPIRLSAISTSGCSSDTVTRPISIFASFAFAGNDTVGTRNQPLQLGATGGVSYEWNPPAGLSNHLVSNPVAIINQDQQYILKAFTPAGCISYDTLNIRIFDGPEIYVPRAFTPNGDGLNDFLKAIPVGYKTFTGFTVYNRYGEIVYASQASMAGWNGQVRGRAQNAGSYTWVASAITFQNKLIHKKGTVLLLR